MNDGQNDGMQSFFNDGIGQVARLANIWTMCAHYREHGDLYSYMYKLDSAELELVNDIANIKRDGDVKKLNSGLLVALKVNNRSVWYELLKKKEALLRTIQDEAGKGAKYKDPMDDHL